MLRSSDAQMLRCSDAQRASPRGYSFIDSAKKGSDSARSPPERPDPRTASRSEALPESRFGVPLRRARLLFHVEGAVLATHEAQGRP